MPLVTGKGRKAISQNISELNKGPQFKKTQKNFGKSTAQKQAIAVAMQKAGKSNK